MRHQAIAVSLAVLAASLAGCMSTGPAEPTIAAMPGRGASYPKFQRDDDYCQRQAQQATGYRSPGEAANNQAVGGAVLGTAVGALAGAAIGAAAGNAGAGAAIGAGTGLVGGSIVGGANARAAGGSIQARYDTVYAQCMSAKGHKAGGPPDMSRDLVYGPPPVVVVDEPPPVYVYPRPYYGGPGGYYGPGPYYRRGWW